MHREDWAATAALFALVAALAGAWMIFDGVRMESLETAALIALVVVIATALLVGLALWLTDRIEAERRGELE